MKQTLTGNNWLTCNSRVRDNGNAGCREEVLTLCKNFKFPGQGQRETPVADARGIVQIIMLPPCRAATSVKEKICQRLLDYIGASHEPLHAALAAPADLASAAPPSEALPQASGLDGLAELTDADVSRIRKTNDVANAGLLHRSLRQRHRLVLAPLSAATLTERAWLSFFDSHQSSALDMTASNRYLRPRWRGTCGVNECGQRQRRASPLPRASAVTGEREILLRL